MLVEVVEHLIKNGVYPIILDDGSDYEIELPYAFRHKHRGKEGFYITWDEMLKECKRIETDFFLFMPDDFLEVDIDRIMELHEKYKHEPYAYNIINDGRTGYWTGIQPKQIDKDTIMSGMIDCGFFCNRKALDRIGYYMNETQHNETASGVGRDLSTRFLDARILMYTPVKSLAIHGNHESKMHKEERLKNPLISKH